MFNQMGISAFRKENELLRQKLSAAQADVLKATGLATQAALRLIQEQEQLAAQALQIRELREALDNHHGNYALTDDEADAIDQLLRKPYDPSTLRKYVANEMRKMTSGYESNGNFSFLVNYADRYEKGLV